MSVYKRLKECQARGERLLPSERYYVDSVERLIGYEVALHLPAGSKFILGVDDAEKILSRLDLGGA